MEMLERGHPAPRSQNCLRRPANPTFSPGMAVRNTDYHVAPYSSLIATVSLKTSIECLILFGGFMGPIYLQVTFFHN